MFIDSHSGREVGHAMVDAVGSRGCSPIMNECMGQLHNMTSLAVGSLSLRLVAVNPNPMVCVLLTWSYMQ